MKKILLLFLALILVFFISRCGNTSIDKLDYTTEASTTEPTEVPTEPVIDETTVPTEEATEPTEPATQPTVAPTEPPATEPPTEPEETKAHEHNYSVVDTVAPDCTRNGHKTYECACGDTYTETVYARGYHTWGQWKVTQEATTSREGQRVRYCTDCGSAQYEAIAKLPPEETTPPTEPVVTEPPVTEPPATEPTEPPHVHSYSDTVVAPTCDEGGYTVHTCSCGKSYTDSETAALGHSYSATVVEPTVSCEGYTEHTCSRCGHSYKDSFVSKLDPPEVTLDYAEAMAYGNRYAADTYGWYIDLSLNYDNAGFNFPSAPHKDSIIMNGGQEELHTILRLKIDDLYRTLLDRGVTGIPYINCHVYEDSSGIVFIYVYYG